MGADERRVGRAPPRQKRLTSPGYNAYTASMPVEPGTRLGAYEILTPLGAGGMGEVNKAPRGTKLGREVAIKVLPTSVTVDAYQLSRCQREAEILTALNDSNTLTTRARRMPIRRSR